MRAILVTVLLTALALAGCGAKQVNKDQVTLGDGSTIVLDSQTLAPGKGAISGVVVDEAIRPIGNANITLNPGNVNSKSDATGKFAFNDLSPGFYTVTVHADGYQAIQSSAEVKAGETSKLRILTSQDLSPKPYHSTLKFHGYIQAWAGIAQFFVEAVAPNGTGLCQCYLSFTPDANLTGIIFEAVWTATVPDPSGAADQSYYYNVGQQDSDMFEQGYCTSPCRGDVALTDYKPGTTVAYLQGPDTYPAYQQSYDMYVTLFYRGDAPAGWSFVNGDP